MADIALRDGSTTTDPRLGRIKEFDERSRNFQIRERLDETEEQIRKALTPRSFTWPPNCTLQQGSLGGCVGWSGTHRLGGDPVRRDDLVSDDYARELYFEIQRNDEWDGGEYPGATPQMSGTSILAGSKIAKQRGLITDYRWVGAGSQRVMDDIVITLGHVGGIQFGVDWLDGMFTPRPSGLLEVNGSVAGGHAIYGFSIWLGARLAGEPRAYDVVAWQNSWGRWGIGAYGQPTGICFIKLEDLETLMNRQGEGVVWTETAPQPVIKACPTCGQRLP